MRGIEDRQTTLLPALSLEAQIAKTLPKGHPVRLIREKAESVLKAMSPDIDKLYSHTGRPSIPPEYLLKSLLWMAMFSIRSERQLIEQLQYNLLAKWFVGLPVENQAWDPTVFTKNRSNLFSGRLVILAQLFFSAHLDFLRQSGLISSDHLSVDGTLLEAWASQKSLVRKEDLDENGKPPPAPGGGRNPWVDFKGDNRSNDTHISATDPDAKLASKGGAAKLSYELSILTENRNNFVVGFSVESPSGTSEREAAELLIKKQVETGYPPKTVGGDKNYSNGNALAEKLIGLGVTPHFPPRANQPDSIVRQFQEDEGYAISIMKRMKIEEVIGYVKTVGGLRKLKVRGILRVMGVSAIASAIYNLVHEAQLALA
jgi:transposase